MRWWNLRSIENDTMAPKALGLLDDPGTGAGGSGGGGTPTFDPKVVPADWLNAQVQNAIAKATGGKGLDGLVNNNKELLGEKQRLQQQFNDLQEKLKPLGDIDKAADLLAKFNNDEELKLFKDGKVDDLVKKRTADMVKRHQADIEDWQKKYTAREQRERKLLERLNSATVDRELTEAAAKAGVHKTAIADVIARGRNIFRLEESGDELRIVPKDTEGQIIFGKDGKTPLAPDAWLEGLKESAPHFFPGSTGGGSTGGPGKAGGNVITLPRQHTQAEFEAAYERARKEGKQLQIAAS